MTWSSCPQGYSLLVETVRYQSRSCHIGHCGEEPLVTKAHTRKWLGWARVGLTSQAAPESDDSASNTACILFEHCCGSSDCVTPAAQPQGSVSRWRAKPLVSHRKCRLSPEWFRNAQWSDSSRQLCVSVQAVFLSCGTELPTCIHTPV